jgi:hypothetical protein
MLKIRFLLLLLGLSAYVAGAADTPPNIIFILADDLGYAAPGWTYDYRARAVNAAGATAWSNTATITQ